MCWWAIAAQVGLQALGMRQQYSAQAKYLEAQARGATKEMNYAFQNYELERQDAYDAAVNDIIKTRINQMQLNSQVNAAIAEGYAGGGRTANRLMRAADADTSRTVASIQDNYSRKSNEVDLNKESTLLSTKDYIANLQEQGRSLRLRNSVIFWLLVLLLCLVTMNIRHRRHPQRQVEAHLISGVLIAQTPKNLGLSLPTIQMVFLQWLIIRTFTSTVS